MGNCSTKSNADDEPSPTANAVLASVESSESGDVGLNIDAMTNFEKTCTRSWPLATQNVLSPEPIKLPQGTILYHDQTTGENRTFFLLKDDPVVRKINAESVQSVARGFLARRRVAKMKAEMKDDDSSSDNSQQLDDDKSFSTTGTVLYVNEDGVASSSRHTMIPPRRPQCSPQKTKVDESSSRFPYPLSRYATEEDRRREKQSSLLKRAPPPPLSTHPSVIRRKRNKAASIIQRAYHAHVVRLFYLEMNETFIPAAIKIQALVRSVQAREAYYISIYSAMRIQALVRGVQARSKLDEKCSAAMTVDITSDWDQLRRFVSKENWSAVESTLDQYPEVAEKVDPSSGEMLLHMICRHPNVPALILDMVIVLYPKALRHSDYTRALPLHHAAAHDNMTALEIVYTTFKDGVNYVDEEGRQPFHVAADSNSTEAVKFLFDEATEQYKEEIRTLDEQHKAEVLALEQALADIQELRMLESSDAKRQIQEFEAKVQAWIELGILKDVFSKPPQQPP